MKELNMEFTPVQSLTVVENWLGQRRSPASSNHCTKSSTHRHPCFATHKAWPECFFSDRKLIEKLISFEHDEGLTTVKGTCLTICGKNWMKITVILLRYELDIYAVMNAVSRLGTRTSAQNILLGSLQTYNEKENKWRNRRLRYFCCRWWLQSRQQPITKQISRDSQKKHLLRVWSFLLSILKSPKLWRGVDTSPFNVGTPDYLTEVVKMTK